MEKKRFLALGLCLNLAEKIHLYNLVASTF